jgi:hypothetical protein
MKPILPPEPIGKVPIRYSFFQNKQIKPKQEDIEEILLKMGHAPTAEHLKPQMQANLAFNKEA